MDFFGSTILLVVYYNGILGAVEKSVLLVNGPNLSRLGVRKPEIYGSETLQDIEQRLESLAASSGVSCLCFCSNSEGEIIDFIEHNHAADGLVLNPGALMMAGWSLRDALEDFPAPIIEVHISNLWAREAFREHSVLSSQVTGVISGLGTSGYDIAMAEMLRRVA